MATFADLLAVAKSQIGKPYVFGAEGPSSFDCSGLMQYVFGALGIKIPRTAEQQQSAATPVTGTPQPGDLVFWGFPAHHVALYVGNGQIIAAPQPGESVKLQAVYGSPTYGRIATFTSTGGVLSTAGSTVTAAAGSLDSFFGQVKGVTLQLLSAGLGLGLIGIGLWKVAKSAREGNQ